MRIRFILTGTIYLLGSFAHAQDFRQLIQEMRDDYTSSRALQIVMEISVYDSGQVNNPFYKQTVDIRREGNNFWYQVEENEMLLNEKYLIVVDKQSQQISYSNRNIQAEGELQKSFQVSLDSIFKQYDSPEYLGKADDAEHYRILDKKGPIKEVHFYIIPEIRKLKEVAYVYREGQYASIRFLLFDKDARFDADTFSEEKYITKVKKVLVPSRFFKKYRLQYQ